MKLTFDMRRILKGRQDIDKICVATCAKHEKNYIVDYVDYYINKMKFDMVIIADNNDDNDDENLSELLANYINDEKCIVLTQWRNKRIRQCEVHKYIFEKYRQKFAWMAFFDVDEYLQMNNGLTPKQYLKNFTDFDCVSINWQLYTDSNLLYYEPKPLYERFKKKFKSTNKFSDTRYCRSNFQCKSFINCKTSKQILSLSAHKFEFNDGHYCNADGNEIQYCDENFNRFELPNISYANMQINHYMTKTIEEFTIANLHKTFDWSNHFKTYEDIKTAFTQINRWNKRKEKILIKIINNYIKNGEKGI